MICASSCSTLRLGGVLPPGTQTVSVLSLKRSRSSMAVAVIVYVPPCFATKLHFSPLSLDLTVQVCSSTVTSFHEPWSNCQSLRTALISASRPPMRLPSMSLTIDSTSIFSFFWTNVRGVLIPIYRDDGWTSSDVELDHVCRLTSCTDDAAVIVYGRGGLTDSKSILSKCLPLASVGPVNVCVVPPPSPGRPPYSPKS